MLKISENNGMEESGLVPPPQYSILYVICGLTFSQQQCPIHMTAVCEMNHSYKATIACGHILPYITVVESSTESIQLSHFRDDICSLHNSTKYKYLTVNPSMFIEAKSKHWQGISNYKITSIIKCGITLLIHSNSCTVEVKKQISDFNTHFTGHVINYPCWDLS